jgi:hypothetical protein
MKMGKFLKTLNYVVADTWRNLINDNNQFILAILRHHFTREPIRMTQASWDVISRHLRSNFVLGQIAVDLNESNFGAGWNGELVREFLTREE